MLHTYPAFLHFKQHVACKERTSGNCNDLLSDRKKCEEAQQVYRINQGLHLGLFAVKTVRQLMCKFLENDSICLSSIPVETVAEVHETIN